MINQFLLFCKYLNSIAYIDYHVQAEGYTV